MMTIQVMAPTRVADAHAHLLRELNEERAAALMRIARTLESLVDQLHATGLRVRAAAGTDRDREVKAWHALRDRAITYRWYLEVQREALGLRQHHHLDEFYPIPVEP
jgi:hypothetical protein